MNYVELTLAAWKGLTMKSLMLIWINPLIGIMNCHYDETEG